MTTRTKRVASVAICGLILVLISLFVLRRPALPIVRFADGSEFRVLQVKYTASPSEPSEHALGRAVNWRFWIWERLPGILQNRIADPNAVSGFGSNRPALSIWWAYIDPKTRRPLVGPTSFVSPKLDSGRRLNPVHSAPADEYRQIFLVDPPRHSKRLRFELTTEDHPVEFSIDNPAFIRSSAPDHRKPVSFDPVEIPVFEEGEQSGAGLSVRVAKGIEVRRNAERFDFEYAITNLLHDDLFVVVEPADDAANSYHAFHTDKVPERLKYALLPRPIKQDGKEVGSSTNRKAFMALRNPLESGGKFRVCIYIHGYVRETGQPFYGSTYVDVPVKVIE
jgi:hypothetical protein